MKHSLKILFRGGLFVCVLFVCFSFPPLLQPLSLARFSLVSFNKLANAVTENAVMSVVCCFVFTRNVHKALFPSKEGESNNTRQIVCLTVLLIFSWPHTTVASLALCGLVFLLICWVLVTQRYKLSFPIILNLCICIQTAVLPFIPHILLPTPALSCLAGFQAVFFTVQF